MAIINTAAAEALIREAVYNEIFQAPLEESIFMRLARQLPTVAAGKESIRVVDSLPMTYFVDGENGQKKQTGMSWSKEKIHFAELAAIVPISENVIADEDVDIIGQITPQLRAAIGAKIDAVTLFGEGRPAVFPLGIAQMAKQAGNNVAPDSTYGITYDKLLGESGLFAKVEEAGGNVDGVIAGLSVRAALRGIKDDNSRPIFVSDMQGATAYALDGAPLYFPKNGGFNSDIAQMIAGDWTKAVYAIRSDMDVRLFSEGVVQDENGNIVYNLMQNDMIALRVTFRFGWAVPNPASAIDPSRVKCPFSIIEPSSAQTTRSVTFTVYNGAGTSTALAGATVWMNGARKVTNSSGQAVFNLPAGSYEYTCKKNNALLGEGSVTVASSNVTVTIGS